MNKIEIYVRGEHSREPKLVELPAGATIQEVIDLYHKECPGAADAGEIQLFFEEEDDPKHGHHGCDEAGVRKKHHIHCHRCKEAEVRIIYNGDDKGFRFAPSATIKSVFKEAISAFGISPEDAGDYVLKLDEKTILQPSEHIGSFVSFPQCVVKLFLTALKPIQG